MCVCVRACVFCVCVCNACVCVCSWVSEKDKSASEFRKQKREMFYTCVLLPGLADICQAPVLNCNRNACWQWQLFQTTCTAQSCVIPTVKQASASPRNSVWFAPRMHSCCNLAPVPGNFDKSRQKYMHVKQNKKTNINKLNPVEAVSCTLSTRSNLYQFQP